MFSSGFLYVMIISEKKRSCLFDILRRFTDHDREAIR